MPWGKPKAAFKVRLVWTDEPWGQWWGRSVKRHLPQLLLLLLTACWSWQCSHLKPALTIILNYKLWNCTESMFQAHLHVHIYSSQWCLGALFDLWTQMAMISHSLLSCRCQQTRAPQWTPTRLSSELRRGEALRTTSRSLNTTSRRTRGGSLPETGESGILSAFPPTPSAIISISEHIRKVGWRFNKCTDVRVIFEKILQIIWCV